MPARELKKGGGRIAKPKKGRGRGGRPLVILVAKALRDPRALKDRKVLRDPRALRDLRALRVKKATRPPS